MVELCAQQGINAPARIAFQMFQMIQRMVTKVIHDLGSLIDGMRGQLLYGPGSERPYRLLLDGEDPASERDPYWGTQRPTRCAGGPMRADLVVVDPQLRPFRGEQ